MGLTQEGWLVHEPDVARIAARLAKPRDDDLDLHIGGLRVQTVVRYSGGDGRNELLVRMTSGRGWWTNSSGERIDDATEVSFDVVATYDNPDPAVFNTIAERLELWRDNRTEVTMLSAPGRLTTLIADPYNWVPLPRQPAR